MATPMHPVKSEAIGYVGRDLDGTVHVTFKSGGTHQYGPFTQKEFEDFRAAPSVGKHFHAHISKKARK